MRIALPALALIVLLAGCVPGSAPSLHDVDLYGVLDARLSYLYGSPGTLTIDGRDVQLTQGSVSAPYAVDRALLVDKRPYLRAALSPLPEPPVVVARIPQTTDLSVRAATDVGPVVYFDGSSYLDLLEGASAGLDKRVVPRPRLNGLRGLGDLTDAEADALSAELTKDAKPFAVAVLPDAGLPAHSVDGVGEQLTTGLYVQTELGTDTAAFRPAPDRVPFEVVAQGNNAVGVDRRRFVLVSDAGQLANLWSEAQGSRLTLPPIPDVDFQHETVLAVFAGSQATGGYGIDVRRVSVDSGELYLDVKFTKPAGNAVTTQATTSPWVIVRVLRGGFSVAWFRDADDGSLLGVARGSQP